MNRSKFCNFKATTVILTLVTTCLPAAAQKFSGGMQLGYNGGPGFEVHGTVRQLAQNFPFRLRTGISYTTSNPGSAADARRVFINNATNGTPEKRGYRWDFRFDLSYPVNLFSMKRVYLFGGPRYSRFTANFRYVGGNEDFDVICNQWAWGIGLKNYYKMAAKLDLVTSAGLDYYLGSTLIGHDTSYASDGTTVNGREDYTYRDADAAVNQPKFGLMLMIGFNYYFN
jgi:hypothetical protein